jgi:hypothetical protein
LLLRRGQAYLALQQPQSAIADFTVAMGLAPDNAEAYYQRAVAYELSGDARRAAADRAAARRRDPLYAKAFQGGEDARSAAVALAVEAQQRAEAVAEESAAATAKRREAVGAWPDEFAIGGGSRPGKVSSARQHAAPSRLDPVVAKRSTGKVTEDAAGKETVAGGRPRKTSGAAKKPLVSMARVTPPSSSKPQPAQIVPSAAAQAVDDPVDEGASSVRRPRYPAWSWRSPVVASADDRPDQPGGSPLEAPRRDPSGGSPAAASPRVKPVVVAPELRPAAEPARPSLTR